MNVVLNRTVVVVVVTVNNNSPIQDYVHPEDQTQPTFEMTPGFKPFTVHLNSNKPMLRIPGKIYCIHLRCVNHSCILKV